MRTPDHANHTQPLTSGLRHETMGQRIQRLRVRRGWTPQQLAAEVGVSNKSTVHRWEDDQTKPTDKTMEQMARAFGVSEKYLRFGAETNAENMIDVSGLSLLDQALVRQLVERLRTKQ